MSGWARLRGYTIESDLDDLHDVYGGRFKYRQRGTYKVSLEFDCDSEWLDRLYQWIHDEGVEGDLPKRPALPSAAPRLPAPPVEGELLDARYCGECGAELTHPLGQDEPWPCAHCAGELPDDAP